MKTEQQASQRLVKQGQRFAAAIAALEAYYAAHSNYSGTVEQQRLEREYKASQRALRAARTTYSRLAVANRWGAPQA